MIALRNYQLKDKSFFILLFILNFILGVLNSRSLMMGGLMDYYMDFSIIIINSFDPSFGIMKTPAFPMWGYGWVLIFTDKKFFLFLIQGFFSILIVYFFLNFSRKFNFFNQVSLNIFKILMLFSFSFISLNYTLSPYSLSINLLIASIIFFVTGLAENKFSFILISSIFYGLLLNFRSDYIYFTFVLPFIPFFFSREKFFFKLIFVWFLFVAILLIPWMLYTYKAIGKPLITSTNSGHVFYIGLGNLPNNKWGITTSDHDERMYSELKKEFGINANSLNYNEDIFLKKSFLELIKNDPFEYSKKVVYSGLKTVVSGIYVPEFYNWRNDCKDCKSEFDYDVIHNPFLSLFDSKLKFLLYSITYFSILVGVLILFLSYLVLPYVFFESYRNKNLLVFLSCIILLYQFFICTFAYHMRLYSSYSYFWCLIILVFFFNKKIFKLL